MYVYVSTENPSTPLAVFPRSRGRVLPGHTEVFTDVFVAVVDRETVKEAVSPDQFKSARMPESQLRDEAGNIRPDIKAAIVEGLLMATAYGFQCPNLEIVMPADKLAVAKRSIGKHSVGIARALDELAIAENRADDNAVNGALELYMAAHKVSTMLLRHRGGWNINTAGLEVEAEAEETGFGFDKMAGKPELKLVAEAEGVADEESGVFWPKPDKTYILHENVDRLFKTIQAASEKAPQNVRLVGPHGCGKTEMAIQFAARYSRPLLIMDCANLREARDWFGYKSAKDGTVFWHESQFVKAVESGNHVILLDELNRATPHVLNTLLPLLDARRFTYLEERGAVIKVGPNTVFCASMNEGAGYTGTSALDMALGDRFPRVVELTYLPEADEVSLLVRRTGVNSDIAARLVQTANKVRADSTGINATMSKAISTRQLLAAAADFVLGGVDTLTFTLINHFSPDGDSDSERAKVTAIIQGKFGDVMEAAKAKRGA
jgi:hypothetical protein